MREIKFRIWLGDKFKTYPKETIGKRCAHSPCMYSQQDTFGVIGFQSTENRVFQQFTGLKDKNGREIYEGDIVQRIVCINCFTGETRIDTQIVEFNPYSGYGLKEGKNDIPFGWLWEIIGNIFENPELLIA